MKLTIRGWSRDHGARTLIDDDITLASPIEVPIETHRFNRTSIRIILDEDNDKPKNLSIYHGCNLRHNGDYLLQLRFSKTEIAYLAMHMLKKETFDYITRLGERFRQER